MMVPLTGAVESNTLVEETVILVFHLLSLRYLRNIQVKLLKRDWRDVFYG